MINRRRELSVFDSLLARPRATGFGFRIPIFPQPATRDSGPSAMPAPGGLLSRDPQGSLLSPLNAERVVNTPAQVSLADSHPAVLAASARQSDPTLPDGKAPRLLAVNAPGEAQIAESPIEENNSLRRERNQSGQKPNRQQEVQREIEALKNARGRRITVHMEEARILRSKTTCQQSLRFPHPGAARVLPLFTGITI